MDGSFAELAYAYGQIGQSTKGLEFFAQDLAAVSATGHHSLEPELHRINPIRVTDRKERIPMASKWQAKGDYFETCNCQTLCPCIFLSPPTEGICTVLVGWHIESGQFGSASLDGLNVAAFFFTPGPMHEGNWSAAPYLDSRASAEQSDALTKIFSGQAGGEPAVLHPLITKVLGVKSAETAYHAEGRKRRMTIRDIAESEIEPLEGAGGADVTISNHPLAIAPGHPSIVSRSRQLKFRDHGYTLDLNGRTGQFSPFTYKG